MTNDDDGGALMLGQDDNTGHTYGTDLTEEDRMSLLEYLKSR